MNGRHTHEQNDVPGSRALGTPGEVPQLSTGFPAEETAAASPAPTTASASAGAVFPGKMSRPLD